MRLIDNDGGRPVTFSNMNGVTFGSAGVTITASIGLTSGHLGAIAAGTQTGGSGTVVFSNGNNVSFGFDPAAQTITASVAGLAVADVALTASTGTVVFSNSNNVSFGMSGSATVTASATAVAPTISLWGNHGCNDPLIFLNQVIPGSFSCFPLSPQGGVFPANMTVSTMLIQMCPNPGSTVATQQGTFTISLGLYTLNGSTLSMLNSASSSFSWAAGVGNSTALSGTRWFSIHSSQWSATPVLSKTAYWLAINQATGGVNQPLVFVCGVLGQIRSLFGTVGVSNGQLSSAIWYPFFGYYSLNSAGLPVSIASNLLMGSANVSGSTAAPNLIFNNLLSVF